MNSGAIAGANYTLKPADMPLHQLLNERDRNSPIITTTNDRVSSQGAFDGVFTKVKRRGQKDKCKSFDPNIFHTYHYFAARQVEPRNTPTTINAAFFHRNFWDNRANNLFNGVSVFGMRDIQADPSESGTIVLNNGKPELGYLQVEDASLASQAVGPPLSELEMSCDGRDFSDVGRKLLKTIPLFKQTVDRNDSVLGPYVRANGKGLANKYTYEALIENAFDPKYWSAPKRFAISNGKLLTKQELDGPGHTQKEMNFSMFWGIAIMLYEQTLVSDQSDFDSLVAANRLIVVPSFAPGVGRCTDPGVDPAQLNEDQKLLVRGCTIWARAAGAGAAGPAPADGVRGGNCFTATMHRAAAWADRFPRC